MNYVLAALLTLLSLMAGASRVLAQEHLLVGVELQADAEPDVWVWTSFGGPSMDWLEQQLDDFGRANGSSIGIRQFTLGELRQRAVLGDDLEAGADVFVGVPHDQILELVQEGLLADLRDYATRAYLDDLPEQASLAFSFDGELLGLPLAVEGPALIVNT